MKEKAKEVRSAAVTGEISLDTAVAMVLVELHEIFALQEEQRIALKVYYVFQLYASLALPKAL